MVTDSTSLGIGISCWLIMHVIILPLDTYWCFKFWQKRQELIIKNRKPVLVITFSIAISIFLILTMTTIMIQYEIREYNSSKYIQNMCNQIYYLVYTPFFWIAVLTLVGRYWIIFYKMSHNEAVINNKWQSVLDPNIGNQNWYLRNIKKWGLFRYIRKLLIIYGIIAYFCSNIGYLITNDLTTWISVAGYIIFIIFALLLPIIFGISILVKIPSFKDNIGIRSELIVCVYVFLSMIAFFIVFIIALKYQTIFIGLTVENNAIHIQWYFYYLIAKLVASAITLVSTRGILKTFAAIIYTNDTRPMDAALNVSMMVLAHRKTYAEIEKTSMNMVDENDHYPLHSTNKQQLNDALTNQHLFDAFMEALFSEYCPECLLSITEFLQFKNKIAEQNKDVEFDKFELDLDISTKSSIVYDNTSDYKDSAIKLYNKYIRTGSEWQINIDYANRNRYRDLIQNNMINDDINEFHTLFDPCIDAMIHLIMPAFTRFKKSKKYQMINHYSPPSTCDTIQLV